MYSKRPTFAVPDDSRATLPTWLLLIQELAVGTSLDEVVTADSARSAAYKLASAARPGDVIVFMSVRGFDDAVGKTAEVLERSPVA